MADLTPNQKANLETRGFKAGYQGEQPHKWFPSSQEQAAMDRGEKRGREARQRDKENEIRRQSRP